MNALPMVFPELDPAPTKTALDPVPAFTANPVTVVEGREHGAAPKVSVRSKKLLPDLSGVTLPLIAHPAVEAPLMFPEESTVSVAVSLSRKVAFHEFAESVAIVAPVLKLKPVRALLLKESLVLPWLMVPLRLEELALLMVTVPLVEEVPGDEKTLAGPE